MNIHKINAFLDTYDQEAKRFLSAASFPSQLVGKVAILLTQTSDGHMMIGYFTEKQVQDVSDRNEGKGEAYVEAFKSIKDPEKEFLFFVPGKLPAIVSREDWLTVLNKLRQEHDGLMRREK
jgi:hypothetical protein